MKVEKWKAPMPKGVGRGRFLQHIQGVAKTPWGWAFSRNGKKHGELIIPGHKKYPITTFLWAHAGGIDATENTIAVPLYDTDTLSGHLCLWHDGIKHLHSLPRRPYAVGIAHRGAETGFVCAIITDPMGRTIDWYRVPQAQDLGGLRFINRTYHDTDTAPRNNLCLHMQGDKLILYAMRAHTFRKGLVVQYDVDISTASVRLRQTDDWEVNNTLWRLGPSSRFGATIDAHGTDDGVAFDLIRTARNIRGGRLLMRRDNLYTAWT